MFATPAGDLINYYYVLSDSDTYVSNSINGFINTSTTAKVACTDYYVARCGDGVVDDGNV